MFSTSIIVFREALEAALLIGVIAAATRELAARRSAILSGVAIGLILASIVAAFTGSIAELAEGVGPEMFNAAVLSVVIAMLAWHNIWMASHGREMAANANEVSRNVLAGKAEVSAITLMVSMAVLREGSETALFLYGLAASGGLTMSNLILGAMFGLVSGSAVGVGLYLGLVRIPLRWFFRATSGLILLIAAGMAAKVANILVQGEILPSTTSPLWDTSAWLPMDSGLGSLLHILVGYEAQPNALQLLFYVGTFALIAFGMWWSQRPHKTAPVLRGARA